MKKIKVLGICGSLRKASTNMGLLRYASELNTDGVDMTIANLSDIPFYNADKKEKTPAVKRLFALVEEADAFILACPEYNYSLAPALKNALDWISREPRNHLLAGKTAAIVGAGGRLGGARSQYHLRQVCVYLDLHLINKPEVLCNAYAGTFDESGNLIDDDLQATVMQQFQALINMTRLLKKNDR
jgi:chromate reductase, NAD(P)H dehydrogenase (quinone)